MSAGDPKALTVRQPWAWAIIHGGKDVENRSWRTLYRGTLLIHAGTGFVREGPEKVERLHGHAPARADYVHGAIIGAVELTDCTQEADSPWAVPGTWHWRLARPRAVEPVPCKGKLNLWSPPPAALRAIRAQPGTI